MTSTELTLSTLKAYEGYLVYSNGEENWEVSVTELSPVMKLEKEAWTFCGVPVGTFGPAIPANEFSPPNFAPVGSFFGEDVELYYLSVADSSGAKRRNWKKVDLKESTSPAKKIPWNIKQGEAIWIKSKAELGSDAKVELLSSSPLSSDGSMVLDLGESSTFIDLQVRLKSGRGCIFSLRERDWYYSSSRPDKQEDLSQVVGAAKGEAINLAAFKKLEDIHEQPCIQYSSAAVVVPYLETNNGPLNAKRSLRVSCDRMTKDSSKLGSGHQSQLPRILKPGFYVGRFELLSSADVEGENSPTIVVFIDVPELYGSYEGLVQAQVLSVRENMRESPVQFFANGRADEEGGIPFSDLMKAALPKSTSIEIGRFPLRCKLMKAGSRMKAIIEKSGSFIVNSDMDLTASYEFQNGVDAFHGIKVALSAQKKTVFLESNTQKFDFEVSEVPVLGRPKITTVEGKDPVTLAGNVRADVTDGNSKEDKSRIDVSRDIKILLQEESAGLLRGVMIEKLGRSQSEDREGVVLGSAVTDPADGKVRSASVPVYVVGIVELRRVPDAEKIGEAQ
jgi:hypothetical protein